MQIPDNLLPLATSILGAVGIGGWVGSYLTDRRRVRQEKKSSLRQAYVRWFTSIRFLAAQLDEMSSIVIDMSDQAQRHGIAHKYMKDLIPKIDDILVSSTEILLQEWRKDRRYLLLAISNLLGDCVDLSQKWAIHDKTHIHIIERAEQVRAEALRAAERAQRLGSFAFTTPDREEARALMSSSRDLLQKSDKNVATAREREECCAFKSSDTIAKLAKIIRELANEAATFIEGMGGKM